MKKFFRKLLCFFRNHPYEVEGLWHGKCLICDEIQGIIMTKEEYKIIKKISIGDDYLTS